jgi:peptidoglycan hydrolase CwlO-like protein
MPTSFSNLLTAARQMALALNTNATELTGRGVTADFITSGQSLTTQLEAANAEQERLKAELKNATAQVDALQKQLTDWQREATSVVKLAYRADSNKWVEFGITAKR